VRLVSHLYIYYALIPMQLLSALPCSHPLQVSQLSSKYTRVLCLRLAWELRVFQNITRLRTQRRRTEGIRLAVVIEMCLLIPEVLRRQLAWTEVVVRCREHRLKSWMLAHIVASRRSTVGRRVPHGDVSSNVLSRMMA